MDIPICGQRTADTSAIARTRRRAALLGALVLSGLLAMVALWSVLAGGGWSDLILPFAGAVLAFAAEMLCLDAAIRHFERRVEPSGRAAPVRFRREASA